MDGIFSLASPLYGFFERLMILYPNWSGMIAFTWRAVNGVLGKIEDNF
jgi:hypothetical protein